MPKLKARGSKGSSNIDAKLSKMQKRWAEGKEQAKTMFDKIPEGEYIGKLVALEIGESAAGNLMLKRQHTPIEGEFKGKGVFDSMMLESEIGMAYVVKYLDTLGVEVPEKISQLSALVKEIAKEGYDCKFMVKHAKGSDFINVNVVELLDGSSASTSDDGDGDGNGDGNDDGDEVDLDSLSRKELEQVIAEHDLDIAISKKMTDDDIRNAIKEAVSSDDDDDDDGSVDDSAEEGDDGALTKSAVEFCEANGVEYTEDSDAEALAESIKEYEFKEEDLDDDEKEVLKALEIYDDVVIPTPKKGAQKKFSLKKKK